MADKNFLDKAGLTYLWSKIKSWFESKKDNIISIDTTSTNIPTSKAVNDFVKARSEYGSYFNLGLVTDLYNLDNLPLGYVCQYKNNSIPSNAPYEPSSSTSYVSVSCFCTSPNGFSGYTQIAICPLDEIIYIRTEDEEGHYGDWWKVPSKSYVDNSELPVNSIVKYDGDTVPDGYEEVNGLDIYSTEEQVIGTWIDGKPIYKKTILLNNVTIGADTTSIKHNINNLLKVLHYECITQNGLYQLPYLWNNMTDWTVLRSIDDFNFQFKSTVSWGSDSFYVTVRYTKTTD